MGNVPEIKVVAGSNPTAKDNIANISVVSPDNENQSQVNLIAGIENLEGDCDGCNQHGQTLLAGIEGQPIASFCEKVMACITPLGFGTVQSVDAEDFSPLFTTTVGDPQGNAVIQFAAITQAANMVYAGPATGADAAPTFRRLDFDQLGDTFQYTGNAGLFASVTGTEDGLIPIDLLGGSALVVVDMVTTANITLSGVQNLDGQTGAVGKKVLVWQQTVKTGNGVYLMASGSWTRSTDSDSSGELDNQVVFANYAKAGSTYGTRYFNQLTPTPTIATDDIVYDPGAIGGNKASWLITGNANVLATSKFGSTNNADVRIFTNNSQRGAFFKTGEFGWGITATPGARFHVKGAGNSASITATALFENSASDRSFGIYDNGVLSRNGLVYSVYSPSTTTWGISAGISSHGLNTSSVYIGYFAGANATSSNNIIISGDVNNTTSANFGDNTVAIGNAALIGTTGSWNTAFGTGAGRRTLGGASNIYVGGYADVNDSDATISNKTGSYNIIVGSKNQGASAGTSFTGGNAFSSVFAVHGLGVASNQIVFGGGMADTWFNTLRIGYTTGGAIHATYYRTSTPEGAQVGNTGDWCYSSAGTAYIKATGTGTNTGWVAITAGGGGGSGDIMSDGSVDFVGLETFTAGLAVDDIRDIADVLNINLTTSSEMRILSPSKEYLEITDNLVYLQNNISAVYLYDDGQSILGDAAGIGDSTVLTVNDSLKSMVFGHNSVAMFQVEDTSGFWYTGHMGIIMNASSEIIQIGDQDFSGNGTNLTINDFTKNFDFNTSAAGATITINGAPGVSGGGNTVTVNNGIVTAVSSTAYLTTNQTITLSGNVTGSGTTAITTTIAAGVVTNAMLAGSIAYSKLSLSGAILNADLAGSIAYSKLSLSNSIVNADISSSAAIAYSKLNLATSIVNADVSGSAAIAYSKLNLTGSVLNADLAGSIAYSKLSLTGAILNADLAGSIAASKLVGSDIATVGTITTGTWSATAIAATKGGTGLTTIAQGSLLYASATDTISALAKDTNATRYLSNTGTSNNPAWAQVSLSTGVTGSLPESSLSFTDITTNNTSTTAHGFFPKLTANRVYYVDNSGALTALALGANGTVLTSAGATSAPTFSSPAGGGITVGTTTITSGAATRLLYETSGNVVGEISGATSDGTNLFVPTLYGGSSSGGNMTLSSTSHATKGFVYIGSSAFAAFDQVNSRLGLLQTTPTSAFHLNKDQNSVTQADANGILLANATAATVGLQSISPGLVWQGNGWKTNSTAGSQDVRFRADVLPVQGAANPTAVWQLAASVNGGAYSNVLLITSGAALTAGSIAGTTMSGNTLTLSQAGASVLSVGTSGYTYRTTNGGSNVTSQTIFDVDNSGITAGAKAYLFDTGNGFVFTAANGTRRIARAALQIANLTNTAGSEVGDFIILTQSGGAAISQKMRISGLGNIVAGAEAALATNATDGFLYIPTCAGAPSGVPTAYTGKVALIYDTTNNKLYIYNGAWKGGTLPGAWT